MSLNSIIQLYQMYNPSQVRKQDTVYQKKRSKENEILALKGYLKESIRELKTENSDTDRKFGSQCVRIPGH